MRYRSIKSCFTISLYTLVLIACTGFGGGYSYTSGKSVETRNHPDIKWEVQEQIGIDGKTVRFEYHVINCEDPTNLYH